MLEKYEDMRKNNESKLMNISNRNYAIKYDNDIQPISSDYFLNKNFN